MEYFLIAVIVLIAVYFISKKPQQKQDSANPVLKPSMVTKLVRVTKKNKDGLNRQDIIRSFARPGMKVFLQHNPILDYPNNIDVFIAPTELGGELVQIGNLEPSLAEDIAGRLDDGNTANFSIDAVTGGEYPKYFGVNIKIEQE